LQKKTKRKKQEASSQQAKTKAISGAVFSSTKKLYFSVFRIRVGSGSGLDLDPGEQKLSKKIEISFFEVLDVLLGGLKASPVTWMPFKEA
jgi:hypothetical protein